MRHNFVYTYMKLCRKLYNATQFPRYLPFHLLNATQFRALVEEIVSHATQFPMQGHEIMSHCFAYTYEIRSHATQFRFCMRSNFRDTIAFYRTRYYLFILV